MKPLFTLLKTYKTYTVLVLFYILAGLIGLLLTEKGDLVVFLDANYTPTLDFIFTYLTMAAELVSGIIIFLLLYFFASKKYLLVFLASVIMSLIVSQGLKHFVFEKEKRPSFTYEQLHEIKNIDRHSSHSFPSGHTSAAFTFATVLALAFKKKWIQILAPSIAALVGVSRVYLGQHYLNDIVVGAILGFFLTMAMMQVVSNYWDNKKHAAIS